MFYGGLPYFHIYMYFFRDHSLTWKVSGCWCSQSQVGRYHYLGCNTSKLIPRLLVQNPSSQLWLFFSLLPLNFHKYLVLPISEHSWDSAIQIAFSCHCYPTLNPCRYLSVSFLLSQLPLSHLLSRFQNFVAWPACLSG